MFPADPFNGSYNRDWKFLCCTFFRNLAALWAVYLVLRLIRVRGYKDRPTDNDTRSFTFNIVLK
jgi:hypothetical protein